MKKILSFVLVIVLVFALDVPILGDGQGTFQMLVTIEDVVSSEDDYLSESNTFDGEEVIISEEPGTDEEDLEPEDIINDDDDPIFDDSDEKDLLYDGSEDEEFFWPVSGIIQESIISAADGSPLIATYDIQTGIATLTTTYGESRSDRYVGSVEAFLDLIALNAEVTSQSIAQRIEAEIEGRGRVSYNSVDFNVETNILTEFDQNGNKTERYLTEQEFYELFPGSETRAFTYFEPFFSVTVPGHFVPYAVYPNPKNGNSELFGGQSYGTKRWDHNYVEFWTYNFPSGMNTIDVFIVNDYGDDHSVRLDLPRMSELRHQLNFPGEYYGAWISTYNSFYGSFSGVELRFFAGPKPRDTVTITFDANGGYLPDWGIWHSKATEIRLDMYPGQSMDFDGPLPRAERANRGFNGWFTTSSATGGTRITGSSRAPNNNVFYYARYSDPDRHQSYWWPRTDSGSTRVPIRLTGVSGNVKTQIETAISNWNNTNTSVEFRTSLVSSNTITANQYTWTALGRAQMSLVNNEIVRFNIENNLTRILAVAGQNLYNASAITSVAVHELGHILGLEDNPNTTQNSIMHYVTITWWLQTRPSAYDVTSVQMLYD